MSILIRKEGILTTIQDLGRIGNRRFGINPSGAMDRTAVRLLNILVGNDENETVFEMHFPAGLLEFEKECVFAIGGADFSPTINDKRLRNWCSCKASAGDVLSFKTKASGNRAYLAACGGFSADRWLDSASTNLRAGLGGFHGRRLKTNDQVEFGTNRYGSRVGLCIGQSFIPPYANRQTIRAVAGPEFETLTDESKKTLIAAVFQISLNSDRMGFRTSGEPLQRISNVEILSSGTTFGTVQLLPDGQMIILAADHQTTGGYPRILTVAAVDQCLLAQLGPGDEIHFELVTPPEAEELYLEFEKSLGFFRTGLRSRTQTKL
jgi:antagonist of KipI